jgi:hypothetical protein
MCLFVLTHFDQICGFLVLFSLNLLLFLLDTDFQAFLSGGIGFKCGLKL